VFCSLKIWKRSKAFSQRFAGVDEARASVTLIGTGCDCIQKSFKSIFIERENKLKRNSALLSLENLAGKRLQGYRIK